MFGDDRVVECPPELERLVRDYFYEVLDMKNKVYVKVGYVSTMTAYRIPLIGGHTTRVLHSNIFESVVESFGSSVKSMKEDEAIIFSNFVHYGRMQPLNYNPMMYTQRTNDVGNKEMIVMSAFEIVDLSDPRVSPTIYPMEETYGYDMSVGWAYANGKPTLTKI